MKFGRNQWHKWTSPFFGLFYLFCFVFNHFFIFMAYKCFTQIFAVFMTSLLGECRTYTNDTHFTHSINLDYIATVKIPLQGEDLPKITTSPYLFSSLTTLAVAPLSLPFLPRCGMLHFVEVMISLWLAMLPHLAWNGGILILLPATFHSSFFL